MVSGVMCVLLLIGFYGFGLLVWFGVCICIKYLGYFIFFLFDCFLIICRFLKGEGVLLVEVERVLRYGYGCLWYYIRMMLIFLKYCIVW